MAATNASNRALNSLLPSSFSIPPKLLNASETLLSLSRQRASHLKPDEEIARVHACAEIACKRLRVQLRLPNIKGGNGAPCRPTVYKKLLTFLEKTLEDVDVLGTPRKQNARGEVRTPTTGGRSIERSTGGRKRNITALDMDDEDVDVETPTKRRKTVDDALVTPMKSTGKKTNGFLGRIEAPAKKGKNGAEAPDYVLPSIRKLCKAFKTPTMVPHVYTGVSVVLDLSGEWQRLAEVELLEEVEQHKQDVLAMIVAVCLMTLTRMQKGLMTTAVYDAVTSRSIDVLEMGREQMEAQAAIKDWIARINDSGWTIERGKGESWWSSVPEDVIAPLKLSTTQRRRQDAGVVHGDRDGEENPRPGRSKALNANRVDSQRGELRKALEEEDPDDVLLPGLGTMMNDAVDYLNHERIAEYELWKADILEKIAAMEKEGTTRKGKGRADPPAP